MTTETITFTGTNGDPWPAGFTFDLPSGSGPTTSIQSNRGRMATGTAERDVYAVRTDDDLIESDVTFVMPAAANASGSNSVIGVVSRYASSSLCYRARVRYADNRVQLTRNGVEVDSFEVDGGTIPAAWRLRMRTTVSGSDALVKVRFWQDGTAEPGTWDIEYTDTSPLSSGQCGVYADFSGTTVTFDVDDYERDDLVAGTPHAQSITDAEGMVDDVAYVEALGHSRSISRVLSTHTG